MSKWSLGVAGGSTLLVAAVVHLGCEGVIRTAPPESTIELIANPEFISANGGVSVITAIVTEHAGTPVSNGTVVQFFTNLGRIDSQGETTNGIARVRLVADNRSGEANVVAISGGTPAPSASPETGGGGPNRDEIDVTIGNLNATAIVVTANPPAISLRGSSYITATVLDQFGNPVLGAPVFFNLVEPPPRASPAPVRDSLDSGGAPRFTDNDGRAFDVFRANRGEAATVGVRAQVPGKTGLIADTVNVIVQ